MSVPEGLMTDVDNSKTMGDIVRTLEKYYDLDQSGLNFMQRMALKHYLPLIIHMTNPKQK